MICKWCGAELRSAQGKCNRCGKEQPALSQCGGFYDLVTVPRPEAAPAREGGRQKNNPITILLAVVCLALVVALVLAMVSYGDLQKDNRALQRDVEDLEAELAALTTEETEDDSLAGKDLFISVLLPDDISQNAGVEASPQGQVQVTYGDGSDDTLFEAAVEFPHGQENSVATLSFRQAEAQLVLSCMLEEAFGMAAEKQDFRAELFYVDEAGALVPLQDAAEETMSGLDGKLVSVEVPVTVSKADAAMDIQLTFEKIHGLAEEKALPQDTKFVCKLVRENREGGSLTVMVEGITLPQAEALEE